MTDLRTTIYDALEDMGIDRSIAARCIHKQSMSFGEIVDKAIEAQGKDCPKTWFLQSVKASNTTHPMAGWKDHWIELSNWCGKIKFSDNGRRGTYSKFTQQVVWDE